FFGWWWVGLMGPFVSCGRFYFVERSRNPILFLCFPACGFSVFGIFLEFGFWDLELHRGSAAFSLSPSEGERAGERGPFAGLWRYRQETTGLNSKHSQRSHACWYLIVGIFSEFEILDLELHRGSK